MTFDCCAVAVERTAFCYDRPFHYSIPPALGGRAAPGCRVVVPFGSGRQTRVGVILSLGDAPPEAHPVKPILRLLDDEPLLPADLTALIPRLKERCFCTLYEAYRAMAPVGLRHAMHVLYSALEPDSAPPEGMLDAQERALLERLRKTRSRGAFLRREDLLKKCGLPPDSALPEGLAQRGYLVRHTDALQNAGNLAERVYSVSGDEPPEGLSAKQAEVYDFLRRNGAASAKELCGYLGITPAPIQALLKKGAIVESAVGAAACRPQTEKISKDPIILTPEQQLAFDHLRSPSKQCALLFGVTGSGKTSVYLRLVDETLAQGRDVIVLVPEIALTPQMLAIFTRRYGNDVALFHSALSVGERTESWKRARDGRAKIVLGTRSAVFAPLRDIGLIVMDEEHEHTYKSEQSPRFHARDVARLRAHAHGALLLLCSATPSIESYANAMQGRWQLETLPRRYGAATLPQVRAVDNWGEKSLLGRELQTALQQTLQEGRQAILLMNRRGYHTFLACESCRHVLQCPQCSISLAYHLASERLLCHYCGYSTRVCETCPECGKPAIRFGGAGTQKLEDELARLFPEARVARMDADSAAPKHAREEILTRFAAREYDILVGTQMVAKGLDFENVTLVGVVSIDQQLYLDDYRSLERSFSLLTQVVGRAGRGEHPGLALVQTINPYNEIIQLAA
ncbi:MAG: primosomal protein N', partial [Oscillospiraceae bacterium]|nr:primosomal protein N' [Oscillospiraceae bacterium]